MYSYTHGFVVCHVEGAIKTANKSPQKKVKDCGAGPENQNCELLYVSPQAPKGSFRPGNVHRSIRLSNFYILLIQFRVAGGFSLS